MKNKLCFISLILLYLSSCSGTNISAPPSSDTGAISFGVAWQGAPTLAPAVNTELRTQNANLLPAGQLDCAASGISVVSASAYGSSNSQLASGGPWSCSDHTGTVYNIPTGSGLKFVVLGKDSSGNVLYRGEQTGITIAAGQTSNVGTVTASIFEPSLVAPANSSTVTNGNFSFTWIGTGVSYKIQVSSSNGFSSPVIEQTVTTASYTPNSTLSAGTYYWRVKSLDSYGNTSAWSSVWSFTISSAPGTVLSAPTGVSATGGNGQVSISWTAATGATSYNIYWSISSGVTKISGTKIPNAVGPYIHTGLTNGTTYYYIVSDRKPLFKLVSRERGNQAVRRSRQLRLDCPFSMC